MRAFSA